MSGRPNVQAGAQRSDKLELYSTAADISVLLRSCLRGFFGDGRICFSYVDVDLHFKQLEEPLDDIPL